MAIAVPRHQRMEDEGESVFASMTDLTVSFLFIILILLAFFATQFKPEETEVTDQIDELAVYLEEVATVRKALLEHLKEIIQRDLPSIQVTVVEAGDVIRFRDDMFESGKWEIDPCSKADLVSRAVSNALADTLPCYTVGSRAAFSAGCNRAFAAIETIQIEGHTDEDPLRGSPQMQDNLDLSARRGAAMFRALTTRRPDLMDFRNLHDQPVLSFAGYGEMRPIDRSDKAVNRRIDIRFILQTPRNLREVEEIRERLTQNRPHLPPVVENTP